jgi:Fe-S-cluster containining protein
MNSCGTCTECCTTTLTSFFEGVEYGPDNRCPKVSGKGCTVYETRPDICRHYSCGWLREGLPIFMRPDKSRTIINSQTKDALRWNDKWVDYIVPIDDEIPEHVMEFLVERANKDKAPFRFLEPTGQDEQYAIKYYGNAAFNEFAASKGFPG